eukprot:6179572-Pleurochrysis_carterae.AAC.1
MEIWIRMRWSGALIGRLYGRLACAPILSGSMAYNPVDRMRWRITSNSFFAGILSSIKADVAEISYAGMLKATL